MPDADAILADLTPPQREAVTHMEGPLLVVAGAGSGKTRVITRRVACLALKGVEPYRILAVTFTNKAAGEMRERIEQLAGARGAWVSTFHSLCASMLRISADQIGLSRNFTIYDRADQLSAVKEAMKRLDLGTSVLQPASALATISNAKGELQTPEQFASLTLTYHDEVVAKVYGAYQKILDSNAALDFDDLLARAATLLRDDEEFRDRWQRRFRFILVDEYQDTNHAQYLIAKHLAAAHRNLCATGDPDQSIYGWRGADIRNILDFQRDYPDARVVKLEQNYRSTRVILRAANSLIVRNSQRHERTMWTENEEGRPLGFCLADDAEDEGRIVVREIKARVADGARYGDVAVFYRTNAQSRAFEEAMVRAFVPYRLVGAVEFYSRQEIKDLLAYLRTCVNERDDLSLERIINSPARGIGQTTVNRLKAWAADIEAPLSAVVAAAGEIDGLGSRAKSAVAAFAGLIEGLRAAEKRPVAPFIRRVLAESGLEAWLKQPDNSERFENAEELVAKAAAYDEDNPDSDLASFLQEVSLVSDVDNIDRSGDAATLMTLHSAKGLEFPIVFLTGMEEGSLPHANSSETEDEVEEERRLCYVGMTRAQRGLVLTAARRRMQYNAAWEREPSRFLDEIDREALDESSRSTLAGFASGTDMFGFGQPADRGSEEAEPDWSPDAPSQPKRRQEAPKPGGGIKVAVGDWVLHDKYGEGRVVGLQRSGGMTLATIALREGGKRVFALEYAPVKKI